MNDFNAIEELDLEPIKVKLMHEESGEGWTLDHANAVEREYRRFLYLMKKFPEEQVAPLMDVDTFWHYHILDTMKYAVDCDKVFGYFLHHFPYIGLRGEDDEVAHQRLGDRMKELYEETFGEDYIRAAAEEEHDTVAWSGAPGQRASATIAWSGSPKKSAVTAWSGSPKKSAVTAWSGSPKKSAVTAWSGSPKKSAVTAWSGSPSKSADGATTTAWSGSPAGQQAAADSFYTERPRLTQPVV